MAVTSYFNVVWNPDFKQFHLIPTIIFTKSKSYSQDKKEGLTAYGISLSILIWDLGLYFIKK
jgi:hypothetical protein